MKKIIISILILLSFIDLRSDNLCWDYAPDRRLRQTPIQQSKYCKCDCSKYPAKNPLTCIKCGHRRTHEQIPTNPADKKYPSHRPKRWEEKYTVTEQEQ